MAIITCENCGSKISNRAPKCSGCGLTAVQRKELQAPRAVERQSPPAPVSPLAKKVTPGHVVVSVAIAVFSLWFVSSFVSNVEAPSSEENMGRAAFYACQDDVKKRLISPSSAKFDSYDFRYGVNGTVVTVRSHVDSANGFGAMLRSDWACQTRHNGGPITSASSWSVEAVQVTQR